MCSAFTVENPFGSLRIVENFVVRALAGSRKEASR